MAFTGCMALITHLFALALGSSQYYAMLRHLGSSTCLGQGFYHAPMHISFVFLVLLTVI